MRLAVLAASSYATCEKLPELAGTTLDLDLLGQRLSEADAGFTVHAFRAERGLAEAVEQVLGESEQPVESLLFFFSGYALVSDERGPALLLDGERLGTFSFKRLKRLLAERARRALVVLDTVSAFDGETSPAAAVALLREALHEPGAPIHLLVANRPENAVAERSPFTSLLELVLDWQSARNAPLRAEELFAAMQAEESMFAALPAAEHAPGSAPFDVLLGNRAAGASVPPEAPPPDEPEPVPELPRVSAEARAAALEASRAAEERGAYAEALAALRVALRADPRDAQSLGRALVLFELCERPDGRYNAACALELFGGANESELELAAAHRPEGLLPALGCVTEADWLKNVLCPERDPADEKLVRALGDAAVSVGLETAHRKRRVPELDPGAAQDLEKSTTTLARTLVWTARLLGLPRPRLHVQDAVPGELVVAPVEELTVLAGKVLASGLTLPELAFRWARCLVLLRPEHRLLPLFAEPGELDALARATLSVVGSAATPRLDSEAKLLARGLKRKLKGPVLANLAAAVGSSSASAVAARLKIWSRGAERVAARAGLLATGNIALAARLTERSPLPGSSAAEQIDDLVSFSLGDEYAALRERLGVAVR
ncbi:MAG TPA: hypothetical protein VMI54_12150 [Polyangiaceae bacterium]|nr:hypothetical protein [Polyangiaceae bacterium]